MDEREWLTATDARRMADALPWESCERCLRFFGLHCCRLAWPVVTNELSRAAVEVTERFLIGRASAAERDDAIRAANAVREAARTALRVGYGTPFEDRNRNMSASLAAHLVYYASSNGYYAGMFAHVRDALAFAGIGPKAPERAELLDRMHALLREVAGNPFRPVTFSPEWRTDTALSLARGMTDANDFGAMPILADALQDAGCDRDDILAHCRDPHAAHVRGCWVVDLLLGKA